MAGLQTMALVSMGAALFLILGAYTFHREQDPTRVAAQIVTGIGFLGAGVIMKQGSSVTGLNTAATLWATAAVGALAGAWMWREAVTGAGIIIAGNVFLYPLARGHGSRPHPVWPRDAAHRLRFRSGMRPGHGSRRAGADHPLDHRPNLQLKSLGSAAAATSDGVRIVAELSADTRDDATLDDAARTLSVEPNVRSVRWTARNEGAASWAASSND
jgi:putative Mg2+ transporter-C (MgtC) family protein